MFFFQQIHVYYIFFLTLWFFTTKSLYIITLFNNVYVKSKSITLCNVKCTIELLLQCEIISFSSKLWNSTKFKSEKYTNINENCEILLFLKKWYFIMILYIVCLSTICRLFVKWFANCFENVQNVNRSNLFASHFFFNYFVICQHRLKHHKSHDNCWIRSYFSIIVSIIVSVQWLIEITERTIQQNWKCSSKNKFG